MYGEATKPYFTLYIAAHLTWSKHIFTKCQQAEIFGISIEIMQKFVEGR